jgi:hypothetical protein
MNRTLSNCTSLCTKNGMIGIHFWVVFFVINTSTMNMSTKNQSFVRITSYPPFFIYYWIFWMKKLPSNSKFAPSTCDVLTPLLSFVIILLFLLDIFIFYYSPSFINLGVCLGVFLLLTRFKSFLNQNTTSIWILTKDGHIWKHLLGQKNKIII